MQHPLGSAIGQRLSWRTIAGVVWLGASCAGLALLAGYANLQGDSPPPPARWPIDTSLRLSEQGATLVLFAHPRCPCTRATLGELEKIVARFHGAVAPWIVFFRPVGSDESWDTDLQQTAAGIPTANVIIDPGGVEARRFNATTSGEAILYNARGEQLFHGGITLARGHAGDNAGRSAIESILSGAEPADREAPVFGCPITVSTTQGLKRQ